MSQIISYDNSVVKTLTGNAGGAISPTSGNISIEGTTPLVVTGTPGTSTLTIDTDGTVAFTYTTDAGNAVAALDTLNVLGGLNIDTSGTGSTVTVNLSGTTDHALQIGNVGGSLDSLAVAGNGELLIGSVGANPTWSSLTSAGGTIVFTPGAGSLNLETTAGAAPSYLTDDANTATPLLGVLTIAGGDNIATSSAGSTVAIALNGNTNHALTVGNALGSLNSLAIGTATQILQSSGAADPTWSTATYPATTAQGDVMFSSAANTVDSLTKDATATRYIANTGAANSPAWDQIELTNGVSGILPVPNGGTGVASPTDHVLIVGSGAVAMTELAVGATNEVLLGNTAADPSWGTVGNAALTNSSVTLSDGNNITVTGSPLSLGGTASFDLTGCTQYAIQVGDATGSLDSLATGTATQIMQSGGAAAIPAWSTATYPATTVQGDVMFSSAANTVVGLVKDANATRYISNTGATNNPAWAQIELTNGVAGILPVASGGSGFATTTAYAVLCGGTTATNPFQPIAGVGTATQVLTSNGAGALPTFQDAGGGGLSWSESTGTTQALAVGTGYITNNVAQVVCTLPDTAALGSVIRICGKGAGGWRISQNAGESIIWDEGTSTTGGVGGYLASSDDHDAVEILCTVADTTWTVISSKGNITVV